MAFSRRCALLAGAWWLTACSSGLGPALAALEEGRLPTAASELRGLEPTVTAWSPPRRAHYALYRGLVELGLGNARAADRWLFEAFRADTADPACFDEQEHGALMAAWRSTGRLPGESGR